MAVFANAHLPGVYVARAAVHQLKATPTGEFFLAGSCFKIYIPLIIYMSLMFFDASTLWMHQRYGC
jgi:hypothetical protein